MRKAVKVTLITGGSLILVGAVCLTIGTAVMGFDFTSLGRSRETEKKTVEFADDFSALDIASISDSIRLVSSEDNKTRIEYYDSKDGKLVYNISRRYADSSESGSPVLFAEQQDKREWYEHLFNWDFSAFAGDDRSITVYLPKNSYERLSLGSVSGNIGAQLGLELGRKAEIATTSGEISIKSLECSGDITLNTVSGNTIAEAVTGRSIGITSVSGDMTLRELKAQGKLELDTTSGELGLTTIEAESVRLGSVSGDIRLEHIDTDTLTADTVSGGISGTIGAAGTFSTDSVSGDIRVPSSESTGRSYSFNTVSGDINLK